MVFVDSVAGVDGSEVMFVAGECSVAGFVVLGEEVWEKSSWRGGWERLGCCCCG